MIFGESIQPNWNGLIIIYLLVKVKQVADKCSQYLISPFHFNAVLFIVSWEKIKWRLHSCDTKENVSREENWRRIIQMWSWFTWRGGRGRRTWWARSIGHRFHIEARLPRHNNTVHNGTKTGKKAKGLKVHWEKLFRWLMLETVKHFLLQQKIWISFQLN